MSQYAAFLLFLAVGLANSSSVSYDDYEVGSTTVTTMTKSISTKTPEPPKTTATTTPEPPKTTATTTTTTTEPPKTTATTTTTEPPKTTATTTTTEPPKTTTTTTEPPKTTATTTTEPPKTTATTTEPPTTSNTTSSAPNVTTTAPTTTSNTTSFTPNVTTTAPTTTTTPAPTLPSPTTHLYQIKGEDNTTCLMVKFGLRIGYQGPKYEEMNFEFTNETKLKGSCGENSSELLIQSDTLAITLTFLKETKKFNLHALNVTGKTNSGVKFTEANNNLTLWQASLGNSYMCNKEQNYTITKLLTIFTFELQVQPFEVKKDSFSTAQECSLDDTSILIPIVVGAALAGLILIVVIAYVIGRRKTYVGYQTL